MIKLTNLNKYFNKGKSNEIHVINNTSITFPEKGLVALTGPSGCGKTTLLNVIGGLDKFHSGELEFDNQIIKKYKPLEVDILRNQYIGYIFQNYNLVEDKTVYENIEIVLNMAGLYDKEEIEERINYVLEAVGMYNYRRRSVLALSGGQQQRVAIARAIAKNPKVVLADEPTGNLDANNTFEVMSIIKKISQSCLVILVSHERSLVDFYADRVIEITDGQIINDYENSGNRSLDHVDERNIYLKDLNLDDSLKDNNVVRYYDKTKDDTLAFKVVEVKDSIYIKAESKSLKKIKFITDDSEINLIDAHYKVRQTDDALDYTFDLEQYGEIEHSTNKKSFIRMKDTLRQGLIKFTRSRKFISKLLLLAYFVISALIVYQLATFANLNRLDEKEFLSTYKNLVSVSTENSISSYDIDRILDNVDNLEFSPYFGSVFTYEPIYDFYQGATNQHLSVYPIKSSWLDSEDITYGRLPANNLEIVIDEWLAEDLLEEKGVADLGIENFEDLIGYSIYTSNDLRLDFEIVGIIQTESPVVAVADEAIYSFVQSVFLYPIGSAENRINIISGTTITSENTILAHKNSGQDLNDVVSLYGINYTVVGIYENLGEADSEYYYKEDYYITSNSVVEEQIKLLINNLNFYNQDAIYFYSSDIEKAIEDIADYDEDIEAYNSYEIQRAYAIENLRTDVSRRIQSIAITLIGVVVYIFFIMRSSMLSRIKEIGIYRSIGATKRDIFKIFIGEIFWMTSLGSLTGYLAMSLLINRIQNMLGDIFSVFYFPIHYFVGGIIAIYLINLIAGLLPVFNLLRKTPSEINSKYDI
ncbi:ATP-binding cassette domain-containing protein [Candidatus Izemoplasma sp. B36]|uniref:ABC transporter ATP-binding protein/permease n=1 Tax=Candidatus Izemoplasma sp. B36 TaxID=3242468 RepID=UPI00355635EE